MGEIWPIGDPSSFGESNKVGSTDAERSAEAPSPRAGSFITERVAIQFDNGDYTTDCIDGH